MRLLLNPCTQLCWSAHQCRTFRYVVLPSLSVLEYKFFSTPLPAYRNHTLFPPYETLEIIGMEGKVQSSEDRPLWDPHRLMVYFHELQL